MFKSECGNSNLKIVHLEKIDQFFQVSRLTRSNYFFILLHLDIFVYLLQGSGLAIFFFSNLVFRFPHSNFLHQKCDFKIS